LYLDRLSLDEGEALPDPLWFHSLVIGSSPRYLAENADAIRQDWPRIPLPASADALGLLVILDVGKGDLRPAFLLVPQRKG